MQYNHETEVENSAKSALPGVHKTTGWRVSSAMHARSQASLRHPNKSSEDWQTFHRNIVHGLIKSKDKNDGVHLIHSMSHDHAVVAEVNHRKKEVNIITVLSKGMNHATHEGDHKVVVESQRAITFKEYLVNS